MKITCIDFETANPFWGSICAVGLAVIDGGKVVHTLNTLVKPHPGHAVFNRDNIRVHGIKPEMVKDAPEFDVLYPQLKPYIENCVVAAHNTDFDISCLRDVMTLYNIKIPDFDYFCTCELSRKVWKGLLNYKLKTVSRHLEFKFKHHNAGEDSLASANIILKAYEATGSSSAAELAEKAGIKIKQISSGDIYEISSVRHARKAALRVDAKEIKTSGDPDINGFFYGKEVVFTGEFPSGPGRREAMQMAADAGAKLCNYVRGMTDFLVAADNNTAANTTKMRKARKVIEEGGKTVIISGDEFLKQIRRLA